jgi:signal transduction histidine kinase
MMRTSLDVAAGKPGPPSPGLASLETKLREGLDQADQLVEGFLTLARAENGAIGERTTVDLTQVVSSAIQRRQQEIDDAELEIDLELASLRVRGSLTLLARMVDNVIDNAIAHNEPRGWAAVRIGMFGETGQLIVESGGRQLEAQAVSELALPFRRLGATRTHSDRGVGLGLAIVDAIATAHGGTLELHARSQGGIRVVIELPATAVALPSSA